MANRAILSLGLACFKWKSREAGLAAMPIDVEVFNVWLLSEESFVIDPSSAKFLVEHSFDFNKLFSSGLPYRPAKPDKV